MHFFSTKHNKEINKRGEFLKKPSKKKYSWIFWVYLIFWDFTEIIIISNSFVYVCVCVCVCVCVDSLGFPTHKILSSENWNHFISFFLIYMTFISFSLIFASAWTSSLVLDRSEESRHPYRVCDLRAKTFSFSPLRRMLIVSFFCRCSLWSWRYSLIFLIFLSVNH